MRPAVQTIASRLRPAVQESLELHQRAPINLALEVDDRFERDPVVVPAPGVELGMVGGAQADVVVATDEAQQIPDLLLPAVAAAPLALDPVLRYFVAQPVSRAAENPDVLRVKADFLAQFPVHRLLGRLAGIDAALRELPGMFADPLAPENQVLAVCDDDGDVRAIAVTVQHRGHPDAIRCVYCCTGRWLLPSGDSTRRAIASGTTRSGGNRFGKLRRQSQFGGVGKDRGFREPHAPEPVLGADAQHPDAVDQRATKADLARLGEVARRTRDLADPHAERMCLHE